MNNEQQELLGDAYENYSKEYEKDNSIGMALLIQTVDGKSVYRKPDREMFIGLCTHDASFSERWGLKIEEQTVFEQVDQNNPVLKGSTALGLRKLITMTYNDKTIESYE